MDDDEAAKLFDLADLVHAIGRYLRPPSDLEPGICTAIEISVMRFVHRHPGSSARAAAEATLLPTSNFSRVLRGLEAKGLVRRATDPADGRMVRLNLTALAERNFERMRETWSQALAGIVDDPAALDRVNETLRRIEIALEARRG